MMLKIFMPLKDPGAALRSRHSYIVQPDDSIASIARRCVCLVSATCLCLVPSDRLLLL